jgi:hypothetical protein
MHKKCQEPPRRRPGAPRALLPSYLIVTLLVLTVLLRTRESPE